MDEFTRAYIECALWSSTGDNGKALGAGDGPNETESMSLGLTAADIAPESLAAMVKECETFQSAHWDDIADNLERAGHDFWLTRNGHGCGFWDGDWPEDIGDRFTASSKAYGTCDLYIGDDGKVYVL